MNITEKLVASAYDSAKEHGCIFVDCFLHEIESEETEFLNGFHPRETLQIIKDDEYFCSARANTFVVMFGIDEYSGYENTILIQANHKGLMHFLMFAY